MLQRQDVAVFLVPTHTPVTGDQEEQVKQFLKVKEIQGPRDILVLLKEGASNQIIIVVSTDRADEVQEFLEGLLGSGMFQPLLIPSGSLAAAN